MVILFYYMTVMTAVCWQPFEIIDRLQAQGYEFVTVDKLIFELP